MFKEKGRAKVCQRRKTWIFEPEQDKTYKITYQPPYDKTNKDQLNGRCAQRRPRSALASASLNRVFAVCMKNAWSSATHQAHSGDWSEWADAQADLSLRWAHTHFVGFVMSWLICAQPRLRSACTSMQSVQSSLSTWKSIGFLAIHRMPSALDVHADRLCWATMSFPRFCYAPDGCLCLLHIKIKKLSQFA